MFPTGFWVEGYFVRGLVFGIETVWSRYPYRENLYWVKVWISLGFYRIFLDFDLYLGGKE